MRAKLRIVGKFQGELEIPLLKLRAGNRAVLLRWRTHSGSFEGRRLKVVQEAAPNLSFVFNNPAPFLGNLLRFSSKLEI